MTSLQLILLTLLSSGEKLSSELYGQHEYTDSHVRRVLGKLEMEAWISKKVQISTGGQGRPQNIYTLEPPGEGALEDYMTKLQDLIWNA